MQIKEINNDSDNIDVVLKAKNKNRIERQNRRFRKRMTIILFVLVIVALIAGYFYSPYSNIREIRVSGSNYFTEKDIVELTGLDINNDKFVLNTDSSIGNTLMETSFFSEVVVEHQSFNTIIIEVTEKKAVFYTSGDETSLYFSDGAKMVVNEENFKLISHCPGINDIETARFSELARKMDVLELGAIDMISEIYPYSTSYDANMIDLLMVNGKHIFMNPESLDIINSYSELSKVLTEADKCLYVDEISNGVYSSACPWDAETTEDVTVTEDSE